MNQNDMDRYFWRTGQRWSADCNPFQTRRRGKHMSRAVILLLLASFATTAVMFILTR
jgi:hypothetical protein